MAQAKRPSGCAVIILAILVIGTIGYLARPKDQPAQNSSKSQSVGSPATAQAKAAPAPPLSEIANNKKSMTDAQWDAYAETLKGKGISGWTGKVQTVDQKPFSDNYRMIVDMEDPVPGYAFDLYVDMSKADALTINKNASVMVSGTIKQVNCVITNCPLELENATYTLK